MITKNRILSIIETTVEESPYNNFAAMGNPEEPMWDKPIVGFAKGDDPYFSYYKETIGDFYWLPEEVFRLGTQEAAAAEQLTVISLGFPQTKNTKEEQRKEADLPCNRWLYTRGEWESMIAKITAEIVAQLKGEGIQAVSLDLIKEFSRHTSKDFGIASSWSHRHTAFIAGLGTFGLSDGLITKKGKAMRFTTIIIKGTIEPTMRPYDNYHAYCKFFSDGSCSACIGRCPVDAITKEGHDKEACSRYLGKIKNELGPDFLKDSNYISGCGLCQSRVPCQDGIPV